MTGSSSRLALALVLLLLPAAARADAGAPPAPEQVEAAKALYHDARELRRQGRLKEALEKALAAYRIAATPVTALEAAELLIDNGRLVEARDLARSVAQLPPSPRESDKGRDARQDAATMALALDARLGESAPPPATEASPSPSPAPSPAPAPAPAPPVATSPPPAIAPAPALAPAPSEPATASPLRWVGVAVGVAGVVAIGVGGGVALAAKGSYDSVASECPASGCDEHGFSVRQSARSQGDVATAVMIAGGVAAAGGALVFALAPRGASVAVGASSVRLTVRF